MVIFSFFLKAGKAPARLPFDWNIQNLVWIVSYIEQVDSTLPCICSVTNQRGRQNVARKSLAHSVIASYAAFSSWISRMTGSKLPIHLVGLSFSGSEFSIHIVGLHYSGVWVFDTPRGSEIFGLCREFSRSGFAGHPDILLFESDFGTLDTSNLGLVFFLFCCTTVYYFETMHGGCCRKKAKLEWLWEVTIRCVFGKYTVQRQIHTSFYENWIWGHANILTLEE